MEYVWQKVRDALTLNEKEVLKVFNFFLQH
jgi:hypothetical protein